MDGVPSGPRVLGLSEVEWLELTEEQKMWLLENEDAWPYLDRAYLASYGIRFPEDFDFF